MGKVRLSFSSFTFPSRCQLLPTLLSFPFCLVLPERLGGVALRSESCRRVTAPAQCSLQGHLKGKQECERSSLCGSSLVYGFLGFVVLASQGQLIVLSGNSVRTSSAFSLLDS